MTRLLPHLAWAVVPGLVVWLGAFAAGASRWSALVAGVAIAAAAFLALRLYGVPGSGRA